MEDPVDYLVYFTGTKDEVWEVQLGKYDLIMVLIKQIICMTWLINSCTVIIYWKTMDISGFCVNVPFELLHMDRIHNYTPSTTFEGNLTCCWSQYNRVTGDL